MKCEPLLVFILQEHERWQRQSVEGQQNFSELINIPGEAKNTG